MSSGYNNIITKAGATFKETLVRWEEFATLGKRKQAFSENQKSTREEESLARCKELAPLGEQKQTFSENRKSTREEEWRNGTHEDTSVWAKEVYQKLIKKRAAAIMRFSPDSS